MELVPLYQDAARNPYTGSCDPSIYEGKLPYYVNQRRCMFKSDQQLKHTEYGEPKHRVDLMRSFKINKTYSAAMWFHVDMDPPIKKLWQHVGADWWETTLQNGDWGTLGIASTILWKLLQKVLYHGGKEQLIQVRTCRDPLQAGSLYWLGRVLLNFHPTANTGGPTGPCGHGGIVYSFLKRTNPQLSGNCLAISFCYCYQYRYRRLLHRSKSLGSGPICM